MTVKLTPLGGVGRFGRNCLLVEVSEGPAIAIDCGARFVSEEAPGFDVGLPDLARIAALGERLLGYVVTHGHEDHIGGLPYAARVNPRLILTTPYTARLIGRRFDRVGVKLPAIETMDYDVERAIGPFRVRFLAVSHSIPDASCLIVDTPCGRIVHSGDFRVDMDPVLGPPTDIPGLTRAGDRSAGLGVRVLLADSTGAQLEGHNAGERSVLPALRTSVEGARGRVVVALFSSHVQRIALLGQIARETGRKLAFLGRGLTEHHRIASDLALFKGSLALDDVLVKDEHLTKLPREQQLWAVTGSQGEGGSGLARLARKDAPFDFSPGDRLVMSARVIPGNERKVIHLLDAVAEQDVEIVEGRRAPHVSGHGSREDLAALFVATQPRDFVALHGDVRHLLAHKDLVARAGLSVERVHALRDGMSLVLTADTSAPLEVDAGPTDVEPLAIDGAVDPNARATVAARRRMMNAGAMIVVTSTAAPEIVLHGVFPPVDDAMRRGIADLAPALVAARGTQGEADAYKAIARLFYRAHRAAPEIIVV